MKNEVAAYAAGPATGIGDPVRAMIDGARPRLRAGHDLAGRIEAMLQSGVKGEPRIAARLGLSTASLRRRMAGAGMTYRQLLEDFRREQVGSLLQTEKPLADVASAAGFADVRSLRKVCIKWFGAPPGQLRREGLICAVPHPVDAGRALPVRAVHHAIKATTPISALPVRPDLGR